MTNNSDNRIYLDYAAATPVRDAVVRAMEPYWQQQFANPQSTHTEGRQAHEAVAIARQEIAETLGVQTAEIVFTAGATEANNLAVLGTARGFSTEATADEPSVLVSEVAHPSVTNTVHSHTDVVDVEKVAVRPDGRLDLKNLEELLSENTAVVSVAHANSEIGTLQPTAKIANLLQEYRKGQNFPYPLLHVDASQSALYEQVVPTKLGADLLTINSPKLHGPKGVGLLWVQGGTPLRPVFASGSDRLVGDYQQLRPGTPPTPLIIGFKEALVWAQENVQTHNDQVTKLQEYFFSRLQEKFADLRINGSRKHRTPHNISITFPDTDHDYLAAQLDARGVAAATTSACQSRQTEGSDVLQAISDDQQALRFSLGIETTREEIDQAVEILSTLQ